MTRLGAPEGRQPSHLRRALLAQLFIAIAVCTALALCQSSAPAGPAPSAAAGLLDDLGRVKDIGSFGLIVFGILWLLRWLPRWVKQVFERYDAQIAQCETSRAEAAKQHTATIDAFRDQHERAIESQNARHTALLAVFREEAERDRANLDARAGRVIAELGRQISDLPCRATPR